MALTRASDAERSMSTNATRARWAQRCSTIDAPMPLPPPVTNATRPSRLGYDAVRIMRSSLCTMDLAGARRDAAPRRHAGRGALSRRTAGLEPAQRRVGGRVRGEEALDPKLVQGDVVRRAEAREQGEEAEAHVALLELDGQERRRRGVEVEQLPLLGNVRVGEQLVEQAARLGVARAQQIAVEPLDEGRRRRLPVDDVGPQRLRVIGQAHRVCRTERGGGGGTQE